MKKFSALMALIFLTFTCVMAQLTTRENEATVEKVGARPQGGDMAANICLNITGDNSKKAGFNISNQLQQGDLLTFKRYGSNKWVQRLGIRLYKDNMHTKATLLNDSLSGHLIPPGGLLSFDSLTNKRQYIIVPGIERHFSPSNIFDVYTGLDLYVGLGRNKSMYNKTFKADSTNLPNDYTNMKRIGNNTVLGLGGIVGINVFIGNLPISVGLEYGLNLKWTWEGKTKVTEDIHTGTSKYSATYYVRDNDPLAYSKLKNTRFNMDTNSDVRLVLNVYFSRK